MRRDFSLCRGFIYVSISIALKLFFHFGVAVLLIDGLSSTACFCPGGIAPASNSTEPPAGIYGMLRSNWRQRTARAFSPKAYSMPCPASACRILCDVPLMVLLF
jgi:hypothetical protein